jgi:hypothetical protein
MLQGFRKARSIKSEIHHQNVVKIKAHVEKKLNTDEKIKTVQYYICQVLKKYDERQTVGLSCSFHN